VSIFWYLNIFVWQFKFRFIEAPVKNEFYTPLPGF
jgi:hypothetical protein